MAASKKKFSSHRRLEARQFRRRVVAVLIAVSLSFAFWGFSLYLGQLGPAKIEPRPSEGSNGSAKVRELLDEKYHQMTAKQLKELSIGLEIEAEALKNAENYKAAAMKYEHAFELQKTIDKDHPSSLQSDEGREIRLMRAVEDTLAEPLFLESFRLEQRADSSAKADDTDLAVDLLNEAIVLQQQLNEGHIKIPIIFISGHGDVPMAVQAMQAGACDFLQKPFRDQDLLDKINEALTIDLQNQQSNNTLRDIATRIEALSPREKQVMDMVVAGKANKVIAIELELSQRTVEIHRSRVMEKMGVQTVADLVRLVVSADQ